MKVNQKQLAEILGVSDRTILSWQNKGMPHQKRAKNGESNQYDTVEVVNWLKTQNRENEDLRQAQARLSCHRADILAAKNAKFQASHVSRAALESQLEAVSGWIHRKLDEFPAKIAPVAFQAKDKGLPMVSEVLRLAVYDLLTDLAEGAMSEADFSDPL